MQDISNFRPIPQRKGSPDASKEVSGWDYWTRVYAEDLPLPAVRDVRVADVLRSELLVRAKLVFVNVPPLGSLHKNVVLGMVKRELSGDSISIQDVDLHSDRWFMNFYRPEDALRVLQKFNGFTYRSHVLQVRFCYPDGTYGDESALGELVKCTQNNLRQSKLFEQKEIVQETIFPECWTSTEHASLLDFEHELQVLLQSHQSLPYHTVIHSMRQTFTGSSIIPDALAEWPTGFIRIFSRTVKVVSNTMCLASSPFYAQRIRDAMLADGGCSVHRNAWEPCTPDEIRTDVHLKQYATAFLRRFGPQHVEIDAPFRILGHSLRGTWPKTGVALAGLLAELSSEFVVINDVIYLTSSDRHVERIVDNLAGFQDDCHETYHLPLATSSLTDDRKVKIVDFEGV